MWAKGALRIVLLGYGLQLSSPVSPEAARDLYFAQVAVGAGYRTGFSFANTAATSISGVLALTASSGFPLQVTVTATGSDGPFEATGSSFPMRLPPGGTVHLEASPPGNDASLETGWAVASFDSPGIQGTATFAHLEGSTVESVVGVLPSRLTDAVTIPVVNDGIRRQYLGFAAANPADYEVMIDISLRDEEGRPAPLPPDFNPSFSLPARRQTARFLHEGFPQLVSFRGSIVLFSRDGSGFAATALLQAQGLMTAVPVLEPVLDRVRLTGGGTGEAGLLLDGTSDGVFVNDAVIRGQAGTAVAAGNFASGRGEIIAFAAQAPPALQADVAWSDARDTIEVRFQQELQIPVYTWIVRGPFQGQRTVASNAAVLTSQIWADERQGISFRTFEIRDATAEPSAPDFYAFTCGKAANMKAQIGYDPAGVNVYYVDTVDFGSGAATTNGVWCGGSLIALGRNASGHLLAHELGHGFALGHTNTLTQYFDTTNVMHNASGNRRYLTEGQTFRAVTGSSSVINSLYNLRPGLQERDCGTGTVATLPCPAIQKRIWADGPLWGPN